MEYTDADLEAYDTSHPFCGIELSAQLVGLSMLA